MFRMILRSEESNGLKLHDMLQNELGRLYLTSFVDRQGHSALTYAVYKEKSAAARIII